MPINTKKVIPVICNANQARSVVATSFLQTLHPSLKFKSYGVNAITATKIPQSTINFLDKWQLPLLASKSLNAKDDLLQLQQSELILVSDAGVARNLFSLGISRGAIRIVDQIDIPQELIPRDPIGLTEAKFELELAKFVFSSSLLLSQSITPKGGFSTFIPWSYLQYSSIERNLGRLTRARVNLVIDTSEHVAIKDSMNRLQWSLVDLDVKPQQLQKEFRKLWGVFNPAVYYWTMPGASIRDLMRVRDQVTTLREIMPELQVNLHLITQPLFSETRMHAKTLMNSSLSNGEVDFWKANSPQKQRTISKELGAQCH